MVKLIVERWVRRLDEAMGEEVEVIAEQVEVGSEEEARAKAREWEAREGTVKVTLHYCRHDEGKPCSRVELWRSSAFVI